MRPVFHTDVQMCSTQVKKIVMKRNFPRRRGLSVKIFNSNGCGIVECFYQPGRRYSCDSRKHFFFNFQQFSSWCRAEHSREKCCESLRIQLTGAGQFAIFYWCYEYVWGLAKCWHRRRDCVMRMEISGSAQRSRSNDDTLIQRPAAAAGPVNRWSQSCCLPIFPGLCYPLDTPHLNGTAQCTLHLCCKTIHRFHNRLYNHGEGPY